MAKKTYKKKAKKTDKMKESLFDAVKIIVLGLLMGAVCTYNVRFSFATVTREECRVVETAFTDYESISRKGPINFSVYGKNGEHFLIRRIMVDQEVLDALSKIPPNEEIHLLIHPNGDNIMEIVRGNEILLAFDDAMRGMEKEASFFSGLGNFMYAGTLFGGCYLVYLLHQRKRFECVRNKTKKGRKS